MACYLSKLPSVKLTWCLDISDEQANWGLFQHLQTFVCSSYS